MKNRICTVCLNRIEEENPNVLVMGAYGNPKCLCEHCSADMDTAAFGKDPVEIENAMDRVAKRLADKNIDDKLTVSTVSELFASYAKRAAAIKRGEWDFDAEQEELSSPEEEEIPEELRESEEDRLLDEKDKKESEKLDKVLNWLFFGTLIALGFIFVWFFIL